MVRWLPSVVLALAIIAAGILLFSCGDSSGDKDHVRGGEKSETPGRTQTGRASVTRRSSPPGAESREQTVATSPGDRIADVDNRIAGLRSQMLETSRSLMELNAKAMEGNPELATLRKEIAEKKEQLREAVEQSPEVEKLRVKVERQRGQIDRLMLQRTILIQRKPADQTSGDEIIALEAQIARARGKLNEDTRLLLELKGKVLEREPQLASLQKEVINKQRELRKVLGESPEAQSLTRKVESLRLKMQALTRQRAPAGRASDETTGSGAPAEGDRLPTN